MEEISFDEVKADIKTRSTSFLQTIFRLLVFKINFSINHELIHEILSELARRDGINPENKTSTELYKLVYDEEKREFRNKGIKW